MIPVLRRLKAKAIKQMGTSGGGNHFVEFGEVEITEEDSQIGLPKGNIWGFYLIVAPVVWEQRLLSIIPELL